MTKVMTIVKFLKKKKGLFPPPASHFFFISLIMHLTLTFFFFRLEKPNEVIHAVYQLALF